MGRRQGARFVTAAHGVEESTEHGSSQEDVDDDRGDEQTSM